VIQQSKKQTEDQITPSSKQKKKGRFKEWRERKEEAREGEKSQAKIKEARGVDIVELTVDSENPAACSLYESVGFDIFARLEWYEKKVI
jgi:hypothetical protein